MADHKDRLSSIFDDLDGKEFGKFQWQLRNEGVLKKAQLDNADREQTIDAMVQTYEGDEVLEVTKRILKKIARNDLVKNLSNTGSDSASKSAAGSTPEMTVSESKGASATQTKTKTQEDKSAREKLRSKRNVFIQGISDANLNLLLDELLLRKVINEAEMESVKGTGHKLRSDKAREMIDLVRQKGNKACSELIDIVGQLDTELCEQLHQSAPADEIDRPTTHNNGFTGAAGSTPEMSESKVLNVNIYNTVAASNERSGVHLPILVNTLAAEHSMTKKQVKLSTKRMENMGILVQANNKGTPSYKVAKGKKSVKKHHMAKKPKAAEESPKRAKKPAAKKPAVKKPAADKSAADKPTVKKPAATKPSVKKPAAKKPAADKPTVKKPTATKPSVKKPAVKKPKKATKKTTVAKKAPAKKKAQPKAVKPRKATSKKK